MVRETDRATVGKLRLSHPLLPLVCECASSSELERCRKP
jgi:hypothetical protein